MSHLFSSIARATGQLGDPAILKVLVKSIALTLLTLPLAGLTAWQAASWMLGDWPGGEDTAYGNEIGVLFVVLAFLIGGWLLFRLVALAVLQLFVDDVVLAVEAKYYPEARKSARALPFREDLSNSLRGLARTLAANLIALPIALFLLFTGVGTALLFWAVNGWLLGRELQDMVWLRHRSAPEDAPPLDASNRFLLGGAIAAMMAIPFLNLLAPVIGAATATHMVHRDRS